uniref:ABC transporter permease n=1 Tax=Dictyoglomus thermophilum TaxID=14 RepID=A0A7C3MKJ5_DICTH
MKNIRELMSLTSIIISFFVGILAAFAVVKELNFSLFFRNEKSIGAWIGKILVFLLILSFVWVIFSTLFILLRIQE